MQVLSGWRFYCMLKNHHTHFQAQVDQCRLHTAIKLYRIKGYKTEQVSQYLEINDANNFRRAFKRWSGMSPQAISSFSMIKT